MLAVATQTSLNTADQVVACLQSLGDEEQARHLMRFFKTAPGEYGHGDKFLGIKVPETRAMASKATALNLGEVDKLLASPWHEVRLCGLLVLVAQFEKSARQAQKNDETAIAHCDVIVDFYLNHAQCANNWDLVDLSVYKILGRWLLLPSKYSEEEKLSVLDNLASSDNLWEQRMSIVCTMEPLKHGDASFTWRYAEWHVLHDHDLMHKAVGWLLREMGKRVGMDQLRMFLEMHAHHMPRTALRYAIEHMSPDERKLWLTK